MGNIGALNLNITEILQYFFTPLEKLNLQLLQKQCIFRLMSIKTFLFVIYPKYCATKIVHCVYFNNSFINGCCAVEP